MMTAKEIVNALGGTVAVATALDLTPSTVSSWKISGSIPAWRWPALIPLAEAKGIQLPSQSKAA